MANEFHKILKNVIQEYGRAIVRDKRLVFYLDDYNAFKELPSLRRILEDIIEQDYISNLLEYDDNENARYIYINDYQNVLVSYCGYKENLVDYIFKSIQYALGWKSEMVDFAYLNMKRGGLVNIDRFAGRKDFIRQILRDKEETIVEISVLNLRPDGNFSEWLNIDPNTYIEADGQTYKLVSANGIAIAPKKRYFNFTYERITFQLIFPPIPLNVKEINVIEPGESNWKFRNIQLSVDGIYLLTKVYTDQ